MQPLYNFLAITITTTVFTACTCNSSNKISRQTDETISGIHPPFQKFDLPFQEFVIDNDSSYEFQLPTGTKLYINPGTFVNKEGGIPKGKIRFNTREFHSAEDLFRSGISMMANESKGQLLQTAGMIEFRAYEEGIELDVKSGKSILVELANFRPSEQYSLYYFDNNKNWSTRDHFTTIQNKRKFERIREINKIKDNFLNFKPSRKKDLYVELVADLSEVPYLEPFTEQVWKIDGKDVNEDVLSAMRINWDEVKVRELNLKKGRFEFCFSGKTLSNNDTTLFREFKVAARPVSRKTGETIAAAELSNQLVIYESKLKLLEEEKKRLDAETDIKNKFKISKLGIWNIDKVVNLSDFQAAAVSFDFEKETDPIVNNIRLFAIYEERNSVLEYRKDQWNSIYITAGEKMKLVAVLPDQKIALVDEATLSNVTWGKKEPYFFKTKKITAEAFFKNIPN